MKCRHNLCNDGLSDCPTPHVCRWWAAEAATEVGHDDDEPSTPVVLQLLAWAIVVGLAALCAAYWPH
jgi:hypothetical protein